jgi:hypothetical protein
MSRPRKTKRDPADFRTPLETDLEGLDILFKQLCINELRVDPYGEEPLAGVFAPVLLNRATKQEHAFFNELLGEATKTLAPFPLKLKAFFARISKLASNVEQPHRNAFVYYGYSRFIEETGREPSKNDLKNYLLEDTQSFKGLPPSDDKKAWTRLWSETGLSSLLSR